MRKGNLNTIGYIDSENAKVIWIKNTLDLEEMIVSEAYQKEIEAQDNLIQIQDIGQIKFNSQGNL